MSEEMRTQLEQIIRRPTGALLVTGPTGSGKSTTLYAALTEINRPEINIITVEDPVEYRLGGVNQVQINQKAGLTFATALRSILRSDPDVVMVGEIRDGETAKISIEAALTGHLVLSTLHTLDATETVNRIVSVFPPHQQGQIRHQLSRVLRAAVSQRLMPRADGRGRVLAAEVLINTAFVQDCIADAEKTSGLAQAIVQGATQYGMQSFDQAILKLCKDELVTIDEATKWVTNVEEFKMRLRGITPGSATAPVGGKPDIQRFGT